MPKTEPKAAAADISDWDVIKAQRAAALDTLTILQKSEQAAIAVAAEYLTGPETEAFLSKLREFEAVSQFNSPFVQMLVNSAATIEHLRTHVVGAAEVLREQAAAKLPAAQGA